MATKGKHVIGFRCGDCSRPAKVIMQIGADRDDWVYAMCDDCLDFLCAAHAPDAEEDGRILCDACYQHREIRGLGR